MGLKSGCKVAIWSIDDREKFCRVSMNTQSKDKEGHYFTDWSNKFVSLFGKAYEAVKGITINEDAKEHIDCRIGWGYERTGENDKKFKQIPFEVTNNYDKEKKILYTNYAVYDLEVIKKHEGEEVQETEESAENVTPTEETSQPTEQPKANNGFVGLDFLNIPEGYNPNLPFT